MEFDSWFRVTIDDAVERLSRGEDPEAVQVDLANRFQETYSRPTDPESGDTASGLGVTRGTSQSLRCHPAHGIRHAYRSRAVTASASGRSNVARTDL